MSAGVTPLQKVPQVARGTVAVPASQRRRRSDARDVARSNCKVLKQLHLKVREPFDHHPPQNIKPTNVTIGGILLRIYDIVISEK